MTEQTTIEALHKRWPELAVTEFRGQTRVIVPAASVFELLRWLKEAVTGHAAEGLDAVLAHLDRAIEQYRGSQLPPDDRTLLLCRRDVMR